MDEFDKLIAEAKVEAAIRAFRLHTLKCNRCWQGISCPEKKRLRRAIVEAGRQLREVSGD